VLTRQALVEAEAGADIIAPSDMMDAGWARSATALDAATFTDVSIMAYAQNMRPPSMARSATPSAPPRP